MAREYVNLSNLKFLLHKVHQIEELFQYPYFEHNDSETMDMMLDAAKQLADTYLFPFYEASDREEPELENGTIRVHESVRPYLQAMGEAGWIGGTSSMEDGGMQIPLSLSICAGFINSAANNGVSVYSGLTAGAANLLISFGSEEQKATYLPKMFAGKWQGTMALTEPQAGSSLSDITTTATPMGDGRYKIQGQKIYISGGDYEGIDNIVHMLLARVEGAPMGTKGISLFIVPKYRTENGEKISNDVTTAGVYHKMGQKACPAAHLMFGEKNDCHGYLLGEEHRGLSYMFQMMNEARIMVGLGASAVSSAAYYASLQYAKERPQGRRFIKGTRNLEESQTLIINHPDVRRMLLLQKSIVEGSISLVLQGGKYADMAQATEGEEKEKYELLLELLTPVIKTFPSEMGVVSISNGVQVLGGGGYCKDFPLENYYRDIRIYPIYEGTTGIQSMDLLGRKVTMRQGKAMKLLLEEVQKTIEAARTHEELGKYADMLEEKIKVLKKISFHLVGFAMKGQVERFLSDATLYMEFFGILTYAWQWLKQAVIAKQILLTENPVEGELEFYESKLHTMKFYFHYELPKTLGLATRLLDDEVLTIPSSKELAM
ncbi:MAG: acyl-CoA dehydrogenase [Bacteroidota bacterium]